MSSRDAPNIRPEPTRAEDAISKLYYMAWRHSTVDANDVAKLLSVPGVNSTDDPRMEMLIRDALRGLKEFWGEGILRAKLRWFGADVDLMDRLRYPVNDSRGFRTMKERTMDATDPDAILAMLRDLGRRVRQPSKLVIGGSVSLILEGLIVHATRDVDVVDELPQVIREDHELLHGLADRHHLDLTHFQSHYLPLGWEKRLKSLGLFGRVTVQVVDPIDMLVCKLFSRRPKDYRHLHQAWDMIDQASFRDRLMSSTKSYRGEEGMLEQGRHNWYVLTGEDDLPPLVDDLQ